MAALEKPIVKKARDLVWELLGIPSLLLNVRGNNGYPDVIFWLPGGYPFISEFKQPGEEPRPKQEDVINELIDLGYQVEVHDNPFDVLEAIITALEPRTSTKEGREILARARRRGSFLRSRDEKN